MTNRLLLVGYDRQMQGSCGRRVWSNVDLAIGIYQPNHISSSL